jgi:hypothetical protein
MNKMSGAPPVHKRGAAGHTGDVNSGTRSAPALGGKRAVQPALKSLALPIQRAATKAASALGQNLKHYTAPAGQRARVIQRVKFDWNGGSYEGINGSTEALFKQNTENTCWAAVIASSLNILKKGPQTEEDVVHNAEVKLGLGTNEDMYYFVKNGVKASNYGEVIRLLYNDKLQVVEKDWDTGLKEILNHVRYDKPVIIGDKDESHVVLLLAWGKKNNNPHVLIYDTGTEGGGLQSVSFSQFVKVVSPKYAYLLS